MTAALNGLSAKLAAREACDQDDVKCLCTLLRIGGQSQHERSRSVNSHAKSAAKRNFTHSRATSTAAPRHQQLEQTLTAQQRYVIATEAVNYALSTLNIPASKPSTFSSTTELAENASVTSVTQPAGLCSQDLIYNKTHISSCQSGAASGKLLHSEISSLQLATARLGHVAFEYLRNPEVLVTRTKTKSGPSQVIGGNLVFIGKLIALGLSDLAQQQLRGIHVHLRSAKPPSGMRLPPTVLPKVDSQNIPSLLAFEPINIRDVDRVEHVSAFQSLVLRLIASEPTLTVLEDTLPFLDLSSSTSPINVLLQCSRGPRASKRAPAQLEALSKTLLFCSRKLILEARQESHAASIVVRLQTLSLCSRIAWIAISDPKSDSYKEVIGPFVQSIKDFINVSTEKPTQKFTLVQEMTREIDDFSNKYSRRSTLRIIYDNALQLLLGYLAHDAGRTDEGLEMIEDVLSRQIIDPKDQGALYFMSVARLGGQSFSSSAVAVDPDQYWAHLSSASALLKDGFSDENIAFEIIVREAMQLRNAAFEHLRKLVAMSNADSEQSREQMACCYDVIKHFSVFLLRNFNLRAKENNKTAVRTLQQRQAILCRIVKQSVQALINMTRQVSQLSWFAYDGMQSALHVVEMVLRRLHDLQSDPDRENVPHVDLRLLTIELAKVHFQIVRVGDHLKTQLTTGLNILRNGLLLLEPLSEECKREAQQALGYLRLGRTYAKLSKETNALSSYRSCLKTCVLNGIVAEAAQLAQTVPLSAIFDKDARFQILHSATRALLELESSGNHDLDHDWMVDIDRADIRAILLECRLAVFTSWTSGQLCRPRIKQIISRDTKLLLDCYDPLEYPLRRRRVEAEIMRLAIDFQQPVLETGEDVPVNSVHNLAKDAGLEQYNSHICATYNVAFGTYHPSTGSGHILSAIDIWSSLVTSAESWDNIAAQIFNVDTWLVQLDATTDFLEMRGQDQQRVRCLALLAIVSVIAPSEQIATRAGRLLNVGRAILDLGSPEAAKPWIDSATAVLSESATDATRNIERNIIVAYQSFLSHDVARSLKSLDAVRKHLSLRHEDSSITISLSPRGHFPAQAREILVIADAFFLFALVSKEKNELLDSLVFLRRSVTLLNSIWRMLESKYGLEAQDSDETLAAIDTLTRRLSRMSLTPKKIASDKVERVIVPGPAFWPLVRRLFSALMQLGKVSKHLGALRGAQSAWDQAQKIADAMGAPLLQAQVWTEKADLAWRSGNDHEARALYHESEVSSAKWSEISIHQISGMLSLGDFHRHRRQWRNELEVYARIDSAIDTLESQSYLEEASRLLAFSAKLSTRSLPASSSEVRPAIGIIKDTKTNKKTKKLGAKPVDHIKKPAISTAVLIEPSKPAAALRLDVIARRIESMLAQKNLVAASKLLQQLTKDSLWPQRSNIGQLLRATHLLHEALDSMAADAVYSMLPESTLSLPNVPLPARRGSSASLVAENDRGKPTQTEGTGNQVTLLGQEDIIEKLYLASKTIESACIDLDNHSNDTISRVQELMAACSMLLSFAGKLSNGYKSQPVQLAHHLDFYKDIAVSRDYVALGAEISNHAAGLSLEWPSAQPLECPVPNLAALNTENRLTRVLPDNWSVVSLNLREQDQHLYLTRYEANEAPFVLRLPLNRQTGDDLDEESFSLSDAREELINIVHASDATVHMARDSPEAMKAKGAKTQWWVERDELDSRLRGLLINMENIWFGGFRSVFAVRSGSHEGLDRFRDAFNSILARHLPSRQQKNKRTRTHHVALDITVLELFTGLMTRQEDGVADLDEALNDLLYFVVDILQYNGEANAYDEIDFDAIIVDVQDALLDYRDSLYHGAVSHEDRKQLILVLDKQLHGFPWESMPCLEGRSVSRMPSLSDIIDRIELMRAQDVAGAKGITLSTENGTYMLNPGGDLPRTQIYFENPFAGLGLAGWKSFVGRAPSEQDFSLALSRGIDGSARGIMVYIGHGSGAQYIRAKTIRRLRPHCNAALLFGCSSASLKEAGEFEAHGTPKNYLAAGAPAVLGSLWDVTDGDVDKFAAGVLEDWGLLPRDSCEENAQEQQKGKGKSKSRSRARFKIEIKPDEADTKHHDDNEKMSLSDAVARSRKHCYLRYLNGAAMVVYGVPVYLA